MISFNNRSVREKMVFIVLSITITALFLGSSVMFFLVWNNSKSEAISRAHLDGALISDLVVTSLLFNDKISAKQILSKLRNFDRVEHVTIYDMNREIFSKYVAIKHKETIDSDIVFTKSTTTNIDGSFLHLNRAIFDSGEQIGYLHIEFSLTHLEEIRKKYILFFAAIVLMLVLFSYIFAHRMQRIISEPITKLITEMKEISLRRKYVLNVKKMYDDEIGELYDGFEDLLKQIQIRKDATERAQKELLQLNNELEDRVEVRTRKLNESNLALQDSIDTIKKTQSQLIQSEKMAALGGLVAGVAHEINTPVGLSVTGITHLQDISRALKRLYDNEQMTQEDFDNYLETTIQLCESIYLNLRRAAELVASFKKVASDQSIEEKSTFRLKEYLEQVLISLRNRIKQTSVKVEIDCDEKLEIYSDAGAIAQIFTNLIMNSLIHAYEKDKVGTIKLQATFENNNYLIVYSDDGKGIDKEILPKIFDPFFTTNRDSGGTGLGLNIIYNIVKSSLGGEIEVESELGKGTRFTITLPVSIDERVVAHSKKRDSDDV